MPNPRRPRPDATDLPEQRRWARWKARFREQQHRLALARALRAKDDDQRIRVLEEDVARLALMCTTLTEVVMRKGLLTRDELREIATEIDALDGSLDGMLDPAALRPAPADESSSSPESAPDGAPAEPPPAPPRRRTATTRRRRR